MTRRMTRKRTRDTWGGPPGLLPAARPARRFRWSCLFILGSSLLAQTPSADEIMRRVSENVDRAQAARAKYVYDQDVFVRLKRSNGKLAREESRKYIIAPTDTGAKRKLVSVAGKILHGG